LFPKTFILGITKFQVETVGSGNYYQSYLKTKSAFETLDNTEVLAIVHTGSKNWMHLFGCSRNSS